MKKAGFSIVFLIPILFLIASPTFADSTGNVSSDVSVQTNTNGSSTNQSSSNIQTHIRIETNGVTKTLDETGPGNYSLSSNSDGGNTSVNVSNNSDSSPTATPEESSTKSAVKKEMHQPAVSHVSILSNIFEHLKNFFQRFFRIF